jgi:hypothetical protein
MSVVNREKICSDTGTTRIPTVSTSSQESTCDSAVVKRRQTERG